MATLLRDQDMDLLRQLMSAELDHETFAAMSNRDLGDSLTLAMILVHEMGKVISLTTAEASRRLTVLKELAARQVESQDANRE